MTKLEEKTMPVGGAELNQQIHRRCSYCGGLNAHFRHCIRVRRVRVVDNWERPSRALLRETGAVHEPARRGDEQRRASEATTGENP
jgi:hypothetical protein